MPQLDDIQAKTKVFSPEAVLAAKEIYLPWGKC